jgi:hypothetical protein
MKTHARSNLPPRQVEEVDQVGQEADGMSVSD